MKKLVLSAVLLFIINISFSNPVPEPPVITEIYFQNNLIYIEMYFQDFFSYFYGLTDFDGLRLVTNSDYFEFQEGIEIEYNSTMVLSSFNLTEPFTYNLEGDVIYLETDDGWQLGYSDYRYGNIPYADVVAPLPGQSIAMQGEYHSEYNMFLGVGIGIEQPHTIGSNAWFVNAKGSLEGWIYDLNNNPIQWLQVFDVYTDASGYFLKENLLCNIKNYIHIKHDGNTIYTFSDTIFPNQTSQQIIHLDTTLTAVPEYYNFPNPVRDLTRFSIHIPGNVNYNNAYLGIYSVSGRLVDRINISKHESEINWNASDQIPGIYLYNIVIDERPCLTKKMVIR